MKLPCVCLLVLFLPGWSAAVAAESDALAIDANIQARHLPYGTILDPVLSLPDLSQVVSYTRCGDSALWTGHYLAAEAFRYRVTGSADAFANIYAALGGIWLLHTVTGNGGLARCAIPADSPYANNITNEEAPNGIYNGTVGDQPWLWIGNTSRDQYLGVFFGLLVTYDMVADQHVRDLASALISDMLAPLLSNLWNVVLPDGSISTTFLARPDQQLALLLMGRHVNGHGFSSKYSAESNALSPTVPIPIGIDCADEYGSYFKFHQDYLSLYTLMRMGSGYSKFWYSLSYDELRSTTGGHANAFFNLVDRAVKGPDQGRDAETRALLDAWLLRPTTDVYRDFSGQVPVCGDHACTPLPVEDRVTTDFVWQRSPFQLSGGAYGDIETAGIDYILPYWMGRFYGVVTE